MAPSKETAQQKAQRLMKAGRKLRVKADFVTVCQCLRDREDLIGFFWEELIGRGELVADGEGNLVVVGKSEKGTPVKREAAAEAPAVPAASAPSSEAASPPEQPADNRDTTDGTVIHRNFNTWHLVPPAHLATILEGIEPITFSAGNMRAFIKRGCRAPPRPILLELLEFTVDVDPSSSVGEDRNIQSIINKFKLRNQLNDRRGRELQLPRNWRDVGIFDVSIFEPVLTIRERRGGASIVVAGVAVQQGDEQGINIDNNYSKLRATLVFSCGKVINIAHEFAKAGVLLVEGCGMKDERSSTSGTRYPNASPHASSLKRSSDGTHPFETPPVKRRASSDAGDRCIAGPKLEAAPAPKLAMKSQKEEPSATGMAEEVAPPPDTPDPKAMMKEELENGRAPARGEAGGSAASSSPTDQTLMAKMELSASKQPDIGADGGLGASAVAEHGSGDEGDFVPPAEDDGTGST